MVSTLLYLFLSGLGLGLGPCVGSCGPLLVSYTAGSVSHGKQGIRVYALFSAGRIAAYGVLGVLAGTAGQFFLYGNLSSEMSRWVFFIGGFFVIFIGVLLFIGGDSKINLCRLLKKHFIANDTKSLLLFGFVMGISPCGPLVGILSYVSLISSSWYTAVINMLVFGAGTLLSPLVLLVLLAGCVPTLLQENSKLFAVFRKLCAGIICFLGAQLVYTAFQVKG